MLWCLGFARLLTVGGGGGSKSLSSSSGSWGHPPLSPGCASWVLNQCKASRILGSTAPFYFYRHLKVFCPSRAVSSYPFPGGSPMPVFLQLRSQPSVLPAIPGQPDRCLPAPRSTELMQSKPSPAARAQSCLPAQGFALISLP